MKVFQNKKILLSLVLFVVMLLLKVGNVNASELNFAVEPVLPKNQVDDSKSYFDLQLKPGETQTLNVDLKNDTNNAVDVKPIIGRATTNSNGVIEYSSHGEKEYEKYLDNSIKNDFTKFVTVDSKVTIPANSTIKVPIKVEMPPKEFSGQLVGGITFEQTNISNKKSDNQTNIVNRYTYVLGIVLQNSTKEVKPSLRLGDVKANQINYRNVITADIHNTTPTFVNQIGVDGFITKKADTKKLYKVKQTVSKDTPGKQIAPNSIFSLPFPLEGDKFKPGDYTLDLTLKSQGYKWHFKKDFTIVDKVSNNLNKKDVTVNKISWWVISGILLLILLLLSLAIYWIRKRKSEGK